MSQRRFKILFEDEKKLEQCRRKYNYAAFEDSDAVDGFTVRVGTVAGACIWGVFDEAQWETIIKETVQQLGYLNEQKIEG